MGLNWSQIDDNIWESYFPNEYKERQKMFNFWKSNNKQELKQDGFIIKKDDETNTWKIVYNNVNSNVEEACFKWEETFDNFNEDDNIDMSKNIQTQEQLENMIKNIIQNEINEFKNVLFVELNEIKGLLKQKK